MMFRTVMLAMLVTLTLAFAACGGNGAEVTASPTPSVSTTDEEEVVILTERSTADSHYIEYYGVAGTATLEELIAHAVIIVRATFNSARPVGVRSGILYKIGSTGAYLDGYQGSLELTFDVLEYLKGTGGAQVKGVAYGRGTDAATEEEAVELGRQLLEHRDARWDGREAIVILRKPRAADSFAYLVDQLDYLWLGEIAKVDDYNPVRQVTVASVQDKVWLPAATADSPNPQTRSVSGLNFFLDDPGPFLGGTAGTAAQKTADAPSISLEGLKLLIRNIETEMAAGGTQAYRECIAELYRLERRHEANRRYMEDVRVGSGLPKGTSVFPSVAPPDDGPEVSARGGEEVWVEGPDAHLFDTRLSGFSILMARPLPTGRYEVFLHTRTAKLAPCDGRIQALKGQFKIVTMTAAPPDTLAESFFDPATSSAAFVGTTTVGTISWEANTVTADLTLEIADNARLDFIGRDGTMTLSLPVANATSTDGVLSWEVTPQPWDGNDQLMLRVRQPGASISQPYPSLSMTLSRHSDGTTVLGMEWVDPAQCDNQYHVGIYDGDDTEVRSFGFHPAPETTTYNAHLDDVPASLYPPLDWIARVTCAPSDGSAGTLVAENLAANGEIIHE